MKTTTSTLSYRLPLEEKLCCTVHAFTYNCRRRLGVVFLPAHCCTDAEGVIAFFKRFDPDVQTIRTYAGRVRDTTFQRLGNGTWTATL
jgi:hypothetical protein